jgi:hypothetical protein
MPGLSRNVRSLRKKGITDVISGSPLRGGEAKIRARYRAGSFSRSPLPPPQMQGRFTLTQDLFVHCHLGIPQLETNSWSLTIDGLVAQPLRLGFSDLTAYPKRTVTSFHQCCGNPLRPFEPTRRIANVSWSGTRLSDSAGGQPLQRDFTGIHRNYAASRPL